MLLGSTPSYTECLFCHAALISPSPYVACATWNMSDGGCSAARDINDQKTGWSWRGSKWTAECSVCHTSVQCLWRCDASRGVFWAQQFRFMELLCLQIEQRIVVLKLYFAGTPFVLCQGLPVGILLILCMLLTYLEYCIILCRIMLYYIVLKWPNCVHMCARSPYAYHRVMGRIEEWRWVVSFKLRLLSGWKG